MWVSEVKFDLGLNSRYLAAISCLVCDEQPVSISEQLRCRAVFAVPMQRRRAAVVRRALGLCGLRRQDFCNCGNNLRRSRVPLADWLPPSGS